MSSNVLQANSLNIRASHKIVPQMIQLNHRVLPMKADTSFSVNREQGLLSVVEGDYIQGCSLFPTKPPCKLAPVRISTGVFFKGSFQEKRAMIVKYHP